MYLRRFDALIVYSMNYVNNCQTLLVCLFEGQLWESSELRSHIIKPWQKVDIYNIYTGYIKSTSQNSALSYCAGCLQISSIFRESSLCFLTKTTLPYPVSPSTVASYRIIYQCGQVGLGGSSNTKISINADFYVFSKVEITVMILCHVKMSINGVIEVKSLGLDIIILNLSCCG